MRRTMYCGKVRGENINQRAVFCGWVKSKRDMGGIIFLDLFDREGILQVVCDRAYLKDEDFETAEHLTDQSVIEVSGTIRERSAETYNDRLPTGTVELKAESLELLSVAEPLPFPLEEGDTVREELRLAYRYLDLRRPKMYETLRFRHRLQTIAEAFLNERGFLSVETPTLTKSTPEGARDYLVPSRMHPGSFYALPQSPQIFKQLLMVGGIDRYYQIARCYRDEDLRADRQPEFTQLDLEMSFVEQEDVLELVEALFKELFYRLLDVSFDKPFRRMTWREAMDRYGSDKPDLRYNLSIVELSDWAKGCGFQVFREATESGGVVRAINISGGAELARSDIDRLTLLAQKYGAKGMAWIEIRPDGKPYSVLTKFFLKSELDEMIKRMKSEPGDLIIFCADKLETVRRVLGSLRQDIARRMGLIDESKFEMLVVTDFPQFEWSKEEKRYVAMHHPFTMPHPDDMMYMKSDPAKVRALAYDFVLNGVELGSGSIRIHDGEIQQKVFQTLGFSKEEVARRFGFFVDAFQYGTPPHGGFAFGIDRLVMLMTGAKSLREVIAFPKMKDGSDAMTEAPSPVDEDQLKVLGLLDLTLRERGMDMGREIKTEKINIDEIATLAKLEIPEREKDEYAKEMQAILSFAGQINAYDLDDVEPASYLEEMKNVCRADTVEASLSQGFVLQNTKTTKDGFVLVPSVIEEREG